MDKRIAPYVEALKAPQGVCNTTHLVLRQCYEAHGRQVVDELLAAHWEAVRTTDAIASVKEK